jgi:uncharacterized protein YbcC (UPF0753/DUF2309 family)
MSLETITCRTLRDHILDCVAHLAHYLPSQGPIQIFVHHNTLHAFEGYRFEDAVLMAHQRYGGEPYWPETRYHEELKCGRITREDVDFELRRSLAEESHAEVLGGLSRLELCTAMLSAPIKEVSSNYVDWIVTETLGDLPIHLFQRPPELVADEWHSCRNSPARARELLKALYDACRKKADNHPTHIASSTNSFGKQNVRPSQILKRITGSNPDELVNEVLIRFCACFLDQGFTSSPLPNRELGFWASFASLYSLSIVMSATWAKDLGTELRRFAEEGMHAIDVLEDSIMKLGIEAEDLEEFLLGSAMVLPGWAGMIWQLEQRDSEVGVSLSQGTLLEFLAVRVLLDRLAIEHIGREYGVDRYRWITGEGIISEDPTGGEKRFDLGFLIFQVAKRLGWLPSFVDSLSEGDWTRLAAEMVRFDGYERRRILHLAYERNYRNAIFRSLRGHQKHVPPQIKSIERSTTYQAVFCIDDREESLRRHLEEIEPNCETFGAAGFFAVAMNYRGVTEANFRPQCPVNVKPIHYVREEPVFSAVADDERRSLRRRWLGQFSQVAHLGSRSLLGGALTSLMGTVATIPLVARVLAPRVTSQLRRSMGKVVNPPATELHLERLSVVPGMEFESLGYSYEEMASIVVRLLQDIGLLDHFAPLVLILGHGSSSLNNPHESAYNCGACCGGRGGPNARAFAWMANHPRVRHLTAERGLRIPDNVHFVGGYHNTCSEQIQYFDLDRIPAGQRNLFRKLERDLNTARGRNAQERCRRFESAPLDISEVDALKHVEQRSEDLSQVRPEYNHATNALCLVGSRSWSRGLFLDRRSFLVSYDPEADDEQGIVLERILQAVIPVCGGINLEYYFSTVDPEVYGCGSKLPHNITSLIGVMTGAASDLRPGLSAQMVEIHEPMRLLFVVQSRPKVVKRIIDANPTIRSMVGNGWVQLALFQPDSREILIYEKDQFLPWLEPDCEVPVVKQSLDWYRGQRSPLAPASIVTEVTRESN